MAEGNHTLPLWQCDSITFNCVLLLLLLLQSPPPSSLSVSKTLRSFDLILDSYYHQTAGEKFDRKENLNCGIIIEN